MTTKRWLALPFLIGFCLAAQAQRADGVYHIKCMVQGTQCTTHPLQDGKIGIGGKIGFEVTSTHELMDEEGAPEVTDLVLFLDGQALPGTHPVIEWQKDELLPAGAGLNEEGSQQPDSVVTFRVIFPITRDLSSDKGKESWKKLLGGLGKESKEVPVSVGLINGPALPSTYTTEFLRLGAGRLGIFIIVVAVLWIGFFLVAKKTGALRDKEPAPTDNLTIRTQQRSYSLSRTQIAVWTMLVVSAYLFIWLITGEYNTEIPRTILAILGISAATFATASAVDKGKEKRVVDQGVVTPGTTVAPTAGVAKDLFSGATGADLHRVQFGLWSVVLMIVFVATVYDTLAMPQFDTSLLGLMGISSAAYAGMKISEKKQ
jgi:hypothetical protein